MVWGSVDMMLWLVSRRGFVVVMLKVLRNLWASTCTICHLCVWCDVVEVAAYYSVAGWT